MKNETIEIIYPSPPHSPIDDMTIEIPAAMLPALIEDQTVEITGQGEYAFSEIGQARIRQAECPDFDLSLLVQK